MAARVTMYRVSTAIIFFLLHLRSTFAAFDLGYQDDSDLTHFITRPEIKAPRMNVTVYDADRVTPGHWFVAPYASIIQAAQAPRYYQTCQTGPAIYDGSGQLIWSGACEFKNQNVCDFRPFEANGTDHLSFILYGWHLDRKGRGIVMDDTYSVTHSLNVSKELKNINMHELNVLNSGKTALYITHRPEWVDISELEEFGIEQEAGFILNCGFREVDIDTGKVLFDWWAYPRVPISTSTVEVENLDGPWPSGWNFFHMNSVDKNGEGDYMISARYTNCIYKVSGKDGSIVWRLGGDDSDFTLEGFNFSKQHDARFIHQDSTSTTISFLDNGSDGINATTNTSSAIIARLNTSKTPMTASIVKRYDRPDGELSNLRGNFQTLPNGHALVGWSDNSYISEHSPDGDLLMEARFASERFVTYRSYKANFTGRPNEPPILKTFAYGATKSSTTTVCYVSWNGATDVHSWEFFRNDTAQIPVGRVKKTGFETVFQVNGYESTLYAQALSSNGEVLGRSLVSTANAVSNWQIPENFNDSPEIENFEMGFGFGSLASSLQGIPAKMVGLLKT